MQQNATGEALHRAQETTATPVRDVLSMLRHDETAKESVKKFLEKLDRFHLMAQKVFGVGFAAYNRDNNTTQTQTQIAHLAGSSNSTAGSSVESSNAPKLTNYWLASFIALIYGTLGLSTLMGIFVYAWCTGKAKEVGWKHIFLDNVLSGNKLLHFMAHLVCTLGGITGMVTVGLPNQNQDSVYYLRFVLPVFLFFASVLNTRAMAGNQTENASVGSNATPSSRIPRDHGRNSGSASPIELERHVRETEPAFQNDHDAATEVSVHSA